jgi:hypothetical protein
MTATTQSIIQTLTTLKVHYEHQLTQANTPASYHYTDLLSHANALLVSLSVQSNGRVVSTATQSSVAKATDRTKPKARIRRVQTRPKAPHQEFAAPPSRNSFPLLPAYQGKTKLEAISTVLNKHQGKVMHQDSIIQELYGALSPDALKVERLRMKAALFQGVQKKLWQKAPVKSSYILKAPIQENAILTHPKIEPKPLPAPKVSSKGRATGKRAAITPKVSATEKNKAALPKKPEIISLQSKTLGEKIIPPMHSDFSGLSKLDAVAKVMNEKPGIVVNVDDIIERLFGQLSLAEYKAEKARIKDVMNRGQGRGLWRQAAEPLSFIVDEAETSNMTANGRKGSAKTAMRGTRTKRG